MHRPHVRGSDHYAPPTREVRGDYSNDGINHVPPQEAFIIIEILTPPSPPPFPSSTVSLALCLYTAPFSSPRVIASTSKSPRGIQTRVPFIKKSRGSAARGSLSLLPLLLSTRPRVHGNRGTPWTREHDCFLAIFFGNDSRPRVH